MSSRATLGVPEGPILNRDTVRMCTLAGISQAKNSLIELRKLKQVIDSGLRELDAQRQHEKLVTKMFVVLSFTKATCDAFISMAAELSATTGQEMVADRIKAGYGVAGVVVDTTKAAIGGDRVNYAKAAASAASRATDAMPGSKKLMKADKFLGKSTAIEAEIIVNALKGDADDVKKSAREYAAELGGFTLDVLEEVTEKKGFKAANIFKSIALDAFEYHERLGELFDRALEADEEMQGRYLSQKRSFEYLASRLADRIVALQALIADCDAPRIS